MPQRKNWFSQELYVAATSASESITHYFSQTFIGIGVSFRVAEFFLVLMFGN